MTESRSTELVFGGLVTTIDPEQPRAYGLRGLVNDEIIRAAASVVVTVVDDAEPEPDVSVRIQRSKEGETMLHVVVFVNPSHRLATALHGHTRVGERVSFAISVGKGRHTSTFRLLPNPRACED